MIGPDPARTVGRFGGRLEAVAPAGIRVEAKHASRDAVEAIQSVVRREPEVTFRVDRRVADGVVGEAVGHGAALESQKWRGRVGKSGGQWRHREEQHTQSHGPRLAERRPRVGLSCS